MNDIIKSLQNVNFSQQADAEFTSSWELHNNYSADALFSQANFKLSSNEVFVNMDIVVSNEDAYLNALISDIDSEHVRYFTLPEIITSGAAFFNLTNYSVSQCSISISLNAKQIIKARKHIDSMPQNIISQMAIQLKDDILEMALTVGIFIWQKR